MRRIVRVTVDVWVDADKLRANERDAGFDMGEDDVENAEYLIRSRVNDPSFLETFRIRAAWGRAPKPLNP